MSAPRSNRLLDSLSPEANHQLMAHATSVDLPLRAPLYDAEQTPSHAYFMTSGMASIVTAMENGDTAEVGIVGSEGVIGAMHIIGPAKIYTTAFIQLDGTAIKIPLPALKAAFRSNEEIRDRILEFYQEQTLTLGQLAACNRLHEAEERLARWLLMAQDVTQADSMNFTQEFLGMMLGSRRTTVTVIAGVLQRAGLIEYSRGRVRILDRESLENAACDCYRVTRNLLSGLFTHSVPIPPVARRGF